MLALACAAAPACADVRVTVTDQHGKPVPDALVYAPGVPAPAAGTATIEQQDLEFRPRFTAVPVGTTIRFPNLDRSRHHVYSFSPAKVFELKLYRGEAADPVRFDEPGIVTLGCNVHDWMIAWVYVVDSGAWRTTGADGVATVAVGDDAALEVWHPFLRAPVTVGGASGAVRSVRVGLREDIVIPERPADADQRSRRRRARPVS